ncbi:MAG: deoxyguanosinetriphosphate triphosphohydrolase family protein [Thermodesulfobacteriota bacterium]
MNTPIQSLQELTRRWNHRETQILSSNATFSQDGVRRSREGSLEAGYRQNFSLDVDRVLHSLAYTRYIDKTQVFYLVKNDHITHRVLHVQLVSKIARTVGRFLRLNEDLIEAIALGHDIGHVPFGHEGERYLSDLCRAHGIGHFCHNVQSVQFLDKVERKGRGWNLCLQTLDGLIGHDGEIHDQQIHPVQEKTFDSLDREIQEKKNNPETPLTPMTLEGCVVRFSDTVGYIGRDIEDAIRLKMIQREELPRESTEVLGDTNGTIVYNLVTDIIRQSFEKPYIGFSPKVSEALKRLKRFNYERIYLNPAIKRHSATIEILFKILFERYLEDLIRENRNSVIFTNFLSDMSPEYMEDHTREEIVRDFIAGMTDNYFLRQSPEEFRSRLAGFGD